MDAMVDGHHQPLTMSRTTVLLHNLNIHTLLELEHAKRMEETSRSPLTHLPQDAMDLLMPSTPSQSQSLSMLATGVLTNQVLSQIALPQLTTLSFWSVL